MFFFGTRVVYSLPLSMTKKIRYKPCCLKLGRETEKRTKETEHHSSSTPRNSIKPASSGFTFHPHYTTSNFWRNTTYTSIFSNSKPRTQNQEPKPHYPRTKNWNLIYRLNKGEKKSRTQHILSFLDVTFDSNYETRSETPLTDYKRKFI